MEFKKVLPLLRFSFQLKHPSLEECWQSGYEQGEFLELENNPHTPGSAAHHHWAEGWWARFYGDSISQIEEPDIQSLQHQTVAMQLDDMAINSPLATKSSSYAG